MAALSPLPALPAGTVTFLFTDVDGSTQLLQSHPAAYRDAVRRHHDLLAAAAEAHGGVVFETVGDAVYAAFAHASDAVAAALAGQRALGAEPWPDGAAPRVRMALHTGEVEVQAGHYFGAALYRGGRLLAAAHGGQVVLSQATCDLAQDALPPAASLRDLGEHRLRDLQRPERVYQLVAPDQPDAFPPLHTLDALPNNLPLQLTSFVGRERDLTEVVRLLAGGRLLTLTGSGGCGKTRLALQAAADVLETYPDGAWFVDLAPLADASLVPATALAALGALGAGGGDDLSGRTAVRRLVDYLRTKRAVLILDNCEHVLDACARLAEAVLRGCPGVRVLATSRELLGVPGETAWRVPSLDVPALDAAPAAALAACGAVRLFVERARAVQPAFGLTAANAPAVAELCRRLDGIPLAIELAAARVRVLTPEQLAARLGDRFRLLTGGGRTALRRQQTLQATVDWSHALLAEEERTLFRRLAVFAGGAAGGWPLEGAEAVGVGAPVEVDAVLDLLTGLVDKSLVVAEARGAEERYRLLETLRQYAEAKLLEAGEAEAVRDRHAAWCRALGRAAAAEAAGANPRHNPARRRLHDERANVRAALAWYASDPAAAPAGLELLADVGPAGAGETMSESRRWLEQFLGLAPAHTVARAHCLLALYTFLSWEQEFSRAGAAAREAREIFEELGDADGATSAASREGLGAASLGDYDRGAALLDAALARARARGDVTGVERISRNVGLLALARRDLAAARARFEESRALAERLGADSYAAVSELRLALIDRLEGDLPGARARLEALRRNAAPIAGPGGEPDAGQVWRQDMLALALGGLARAEGRYAAARVHLHDALRRIHRRGEGALLLSAVCLAGMLEIALAAGARGVTIIAAGARGEGPIGIIHMPDVRVEVPGFLEQARQTMGETAYAAAWADGQAMTLEQAVAFALEEPAPGPPAR